MNHAKFFTARFSALLCGILAVTIITVPVLMATLPKTDYSPEENRMLSAMPRLSAESLSDGQYTRALSQYLCDHLPLRGTLLKTKSAVEYAALKRENNDVIAAEDGYLIKHFSYTKPQRQMLEQNIAAAKVLTEALSGRQKPAVFVLAPRAIDVLDHLCPPFLSEPYSIWEKEAAQGLSQSVRQQLRAKAAEGEDVWFRTDHHWTALGAYYVYAVLGDALGYKPYPLSDFRATAVCEDFLGTSYSACLAPLTRPDSIIAMRYEGDGDFVCEDRITGKRQIGFYRREALSTAAKYEYFLGRNTAHLKITKSGDQPRQTLTVIKDSYAQCLVPFLARHFDIELIDLRYFRADATDTLCKITQSPHYAGTLILCNVDTLTADVGFLRLETEKMQ